MRTLLPFLYFKGLTQAYFVKTSIPHNKYFMPRLKEDKNSISVKFVDQIKH